MIEFLPIFTFEPIKTLLPNLTDLYIFFLGAFKLRSGKSISAVG